MSTKNDITGDSLTSRANTQQYRDNYDLIFGKKSGRGETSSIQRIEEDGTTSWADKPASESAQQ